MNILLISEYILLAALAIFTVACIRIATRKTIGMGLVGTAALSIAMAVILIIVQNIYQISYCKDIATALVLLGPVGTIAFARVLRGYR
ncbi:MAG TPA: monovalent cation/H+ antiporter complex subunit F, partial [Methanobacteriaceae archaeon]|nr:monovalent cation/H+ antiporter complex subunit F [Methanobacteriaceae archaeon]